MWRATVEPAWDLAAWRGPARQALCADLPPHLLDWSGDGGLLGSRDLIEAVPVLAAPSVPGAFLRLAANILAHRDPGGSALLYALLWRLTHGEPALLGHETDPDVRRALQLQKSVQRDVHKMEAFVRFREVRGEAGAFVAWYEPDHRIVDLVAPFFMKRFAGMRWAILTPYRRVLWDGAVLTFAGGGSVAEIPAEDASEALWRRYYASIFNPARLNPAVMRAEMPQRFWKHLPEARDIPALVRDAAPRVQAMLARAPEAPRKLVPAPVAVTAEKSGTLEGVQAAVRGCRACPLWRAATQPVVGEGPSDARIVLVGEQPGDEEDLRGRPFTGPAGRLLDRALADAGLARDTLYLTNAVKHFKFEQRGKRRLHVRANAAEQAACRGWLEEELDAIRPEVIVCLGATAAHALLGPDFALMRHRGRWQQAGETAAVLATVHPSWVLRQPGPSQAAAYRSLVDDLALVAERVRMSAPERARAEAKAAGAS